MPETAILAAFVAFCRIGSCFMLMPGLGSPRVPVQVRLFMAVAASIALLIHLWDVIVPHVAARVDGLLPMIVSELLTGGLIGLVARFYILALQFIAGAATMMLGFSAAGGVAIEEDAPQQPLAALISLAALMVLFVLDFHHEIVRALVASYQTLPIETVFDPRGALVDLADTLSESFFIALRLGSPFVAYAILVNLATGFINKLAPQIPIYFISLPFVIAGGLIMVYFGIGTMLALFGDGFVTATIGR